MKNFLNTQSGSVLIFSLIVLSLALVSALSISVSTLSNRKASLTTAHSAESFQVADSGVELVLQKIYKENPVTLNALSASIPGTTCADGVISGNTGSGTYKVSFFNNSNTALSCGGNDYEWREGVVKIKSEGVASGTSRTIETAILRDECPNFTGIQDTLPANATKSGVSCSCNAGFSWDGGQCAVVAAVPNAGFGFVYLPGNQFLCDMSNNKVPNGPYQGYFNAGPLRSMAIGTCQGIAARVVTNPQCQRIDNFDFLCAGAPFNAGNCGVNARWTVYRCTCSNIPSSSTGC